MGNSFLKEKMQSIKDFAVDEILNNPINLGLLVLLGFVAFQTIKPKRKVIPPKPPKVIEPRDFTPRQLSAFDGKNGEIYLAVAGKVFDVSSKPDFYGPGINYELTG
jgi:Cytochrome b5-like Heme/Steroid binding domain